MDSAFIPPTNPGANCQAHRIRIDAAIRRVLDKGWYILGDEVAAFETEFARFVGTPFALGVASGTDALVMALRILGIGAGDAVFTVSHTAVATVSAIELAGARPVLLDVDETTFTLDPNALESALTDWRADPGVFGGATPKAVIPVHLYGHPADMRGITRIARANGLSIVEDCAQAHGASLDGQAVGAWGDLAAFSFYPTKNLGAIGDGGAVTFHDAAYLERGKMLREYGWRERLSVVPGMNSRLDELQAAILRVKLTALDDENRRRRRIAGAYSAALAGTVDLPLIRPGQEIVHAYHQFVIRHPERDRLRQHLRDEHNIAALIHYPQAVHQQPAYRNRGLASGAGLKVTERLCGSILSLPLFPELTDGEVARVCAAVKAF